MILWEYQVKAERVPDFESHYNANGIWAELFRKSPGYLGTDLIRDQHNTLRFVTIDRWDSPESYDAFKMEWRDDYNALDTLCGDLTERESLLGYFSSPA